MLSVALGLALSSTVPVLMAPGIACAAPGDRAVLVVDTGSVDHRYCVDLNAPSVSGLELIQLASNQYGFEYRFDGGAVCSLDGVGTTAAQECFGAMPDFWGYWQGDANGGWTWSSVGAGETAVEPGDIEGWSWGPGDDGATHQQPPTTLFADACEDIPEPAPSGEGGGPTPPPGGSGSPGDSPQNDQSGSGSDGGNEGSQSRGAESGPEETTDRVGDRGGEATGAGPGGAPGGEAAGQPSPSSSPVGSLAAPPGSTPGPPIAGLVTLAIVAGLTIAGAVTSIRRRAT